MKNIGNTYPQGRGAQGRDPTFNRDIRGATKSIDPKQKAAHRARLFLDVS